MGGLAQIDCMKQFVQFGMDKEMALGGALFELESVRSVPTDAQSGWWDIEWWWDQPGVPHVAEFVAGVTQGARHAPTARHWMGYVAIHSVRLAAEQAKSLVGIKMAKAMEGMELPPEIALQPGKVFYRAGDHELMPNIFVGQVHPPEGDPTTSSRSRRWSPASRRPARSRYRLQADLIRPSRCRDCQGPLPCARAGRPDLYPPHTQAHHAHRYTTKRPADAATRAVQRHQRPDHRLVLRADGARGGDDPQPEQRDQFRAWQFPRARRLFRLRHDPLSPASGSRCWLRRCWSACSATSWNS